MMGILRIILIAVVLYLLYRLAKGIFGLTGGKTGRLSGKKMPGKGEDLVQDPFCHTHVPLSQAYQATIGGKTVYFCSRECFEKYKEKTEGEQVQ